MNPKPQEKLEENSSEAEIVDIASVTKTSPSQELKTQLEIAMARANKIAGQENIVDPKPYKVFGKREYTKEQWEERRKEIIRQAVEKGDKQARAEKIRETIRKVMEKPLPPKKEGSELKQASGAGESETAPNIKEVSKPNIDIRNVLSRSEGGVRKTKPEKIENNLETKSKIFEPLEIVKVKGSEKDWSVVDFSPLDQIYVLQNGEQEIRVPREEISEPEIEKPKNLPKKEPSPNHNPFKPGQKVTAKGSSSEWRVVKYDGVYYHLTKVDNYGFNQISRFSPEEVSRANSWWQKLANSLTEKEGDKHEALEVGTKVEVLGEKGLWQVDEYFPETGEYHLSKRLGAGTFVGKFNQEKVSKVTFPWLTKIKKYFTKTK